MKFRAQGLPTFPLVNAYAREEFVLKKRETNSHLKSTKKTKIISSPVIYKDKISDHTSHTKKAWFAPYRNKYGEKAKHKTDFFHMPAIWKTDTLVTCYPVSAVFSQNWFCKRASTEWKR